MIVALVIGLILTFTAVMPLVSDYSETKTFTNKGYYDMTYTESDSVTISWDHTDPKKITINDNTVDLTVGVGLSYTIVCGDDWIIRYTPSNTDDRLTVIGGSTYAEAAVSTEKDLTISATGGTASITITGADAISKTYTELYYISSDGAYVMKNTDEVAYVNGDSEILAMGTSNITGLSGIGVKITGTIDDDFTGSIYRRDNATVESITANYVEDGNYIDLYKISSFDVVIKDTSNDVTGNASYTYFIVPAKVTAEPDNPTAYKNLVSVIPLFALILLVAGAASLVYFKNKD